MSLGVHQENILVIWDLEQGLVLQSVRIQSASTNMIVINQALANTEDELDHIHFCTVGSKGHFCFWQYTFEENDLGMSNIEVTPELEETDFVSAVYSPVVNDKQMVVIGCNDGAILSYDVNNIDF